jgi:malonate transporter and related proteins
MNAILNIIAPVFALILVGYGVARTPKWTPDATAYFNNFVFYVALPTLLFGKLASGRAFDGVEPLIAAAYFGGSLISMVLIIAFSRTVFRLPGEELALLGMGSGFSNTVLLGLPLIVLTFGDRAVGPITTLIAFNTLLLLPITILLIEISRGRASQKSLARIAIAPVTALIRNPILIAILTGAAWSFTGIGLALPVERYIELMSGAAGPCALFVLGASLAEYKLAGRPAETATMIGFKLIVHPVLVWLLCTQVFGLDALTTGIATMMAAIPVGATVFTVAQQYRTFVGPVTSSILISTGISAGTLAVVIGFLR